MISLDRDVREKIKLITKHICESDGWGCIVCIKAEMQAQCALELINPPTCSLCESILPFNLANYFSVPVENEDTAIRCQQIIEKFNLTYTCPGFNLWGLCPCKGDDNLTDENSEKIRNKFKDLSSGRLVYAYYWKDTNLPVYVGSTVNLLTRDKAWSKMAKTPKNNSRFGKLLHQYGRESFILKILEPKTTWDASLWLEDYWMKKLKTRTKDGNGGMNNERAEIPWS
jgi:hypothetical protein